MPTVANETRVHKLLQIQLREHFGEAARLPPKVAEFIESVDAAYLDFERERDVLQRALVHSGHELLQANSEMRAVFKVVPDLFLWLDERGVITRIQAGDPKDLYAPPDKLLGKCFWDAPTRQRSELRRAFAAASGPQQTLEYALELQGEERWFEVRLMRLIDGAKLAIIRNITSQRRVQADLLRASKLESLGALAAGIAHDFNNMLVAILGNITMARLSDREESNNLLEEAAQAARRARDLTEQLLTLGHGSQLQTSVCSLNDLTEEAVGLMLRGSSADASFKLDPGLWSVIADASKITQVIQNLVINASQAMPCGGVVRILTQNVTLQRPHGPLAPGAYARLAITDTGRGIPEDVLPRIFDPYFTTKKTGSGLGLATSFALIQEHEGFIEVESAENIGTTFWIWLPATKAQARRDTEAPRSPAQWSGAALVVDDDASVLQFATRALQKLGMRPVRASSGEEALRLARDQDFRLILMDLTLPGGISGVQAVAQLRREFPHVRAVASTGTSTDPVLDDPTRFGFAAVLPKPYALDQVQEALEAALGPPERA